jgi:hypothetical protein
MKAIWGNKGLHAARVAGQKASYAKDPKRAPGHAECMKRMWEGQEFRGMMSAIHTARYGSRSERLKTGAACQASRVLHGSSGFKGVSKRGSGWMARIKYERVTYRLGTHPTPELAATAYNAAARKFYGNAAFQNVIPI